jgi:hypothetical protein
LSRRRPGTVLAALLLAAAGCQRISNEQLVAHYRANCALLGLPPASSDFTDCVLHQQVDQMNADFAAVTRDSLPPPWTPWLRPGQ